jgi:GNAT superfamily N-acetyltransferase
MPTPITPVYARGDLAEMLAIEEQQIEETVADLTEEQMTWRPVPSAKSALDILWHLAYDEQHRPDKPTNKAESLAAFRAANDDLRRDIAAPGKLDEPISWWTGEAVPYRGVILGAIRHRAFHLGELVYLRQALGLDEPKYYHESSDPPVHVTLPGDEDTRAVITPSATVRGSRILDWRWRDAAAARALLAHIAGAAGPTVDVILPLGDPRAKKLQALGFTPYMHTVVTRLEFDAPWPLPPLPPGLEMVPYRRAWAAAFSAAEARAMAEEPDFQELGSPTGYEVMEDGIFRVVRRPADGAILAFSRVELRGDSGWISWMGVVPEARRQGLARALLATAMARLVEMGRNVLEAECTVQTDSHRFWSHVGFRDGPQRVSYKWTSA